MKFEEEEDRSEFNFKLFFGEKLFFIRNGGLNKV